MVEGDSLRRNVFSGTGRMPGKQRIRKNGKSRKSAGISSKVGEAGSGKVTGRSGGRGSGGGGMP